MLFPFYMPSIRLNLSFNTGGNTEELQTFWSNRFKLMQSECEKAGVDTYVETGHNLMNAGLVENAIKQDLFDEVTFVKIKRDPMKLALSFHKRADFVNFCTRALWYLDPSYKRVLVPKDEVLQHKYGYQYKTVWYIKEMFARMDRYSEMLNDVEEIETQDLSYPEVIGHIARREGKTVEPQNSGPVFVRINDEEREIYRELIERMFNEDSSDNATRKDDELTSGSMSGGYAVGVIR